MKPANSETVLAPAAADLPPSAARSAAKHQGLVVAGGVLGALAASACCILPLLLFGVGIGGAWIGNLTALAPYQPIFIATALGFLAAGYYLVYLAPKRACAAGQVCTRPQSGGIIKTSLWIATALVAAALAFPYVAPILLDA